MGCKWFALLLGAFQGLSAQTGAGGAGGGEDGLSSILHSLGRQAGGVSKARCEADKHGQEAGMGLEMVARRDGSGEILPELVLAFFFSPLRYTAH